MALKTHLINVTYLKSQFNILISPPFLIAKREAELDVIISAQSQLEVMIKSHQKFYPGLSLSLALTLAARDLACELGQLSIVTQKNFFQYETSLTNVKDQLCFKKVKKYLPAANHIKLLGDIVLYITEEPIVALAKILTQPALLQTYLLNPELQVCGLAHSFHNSVDHCVAIVFADQIREDTK